MMQERGWLTKTVLTRHNNSVSVIHRFEVQSQQTADNQCDPVLAVLVLALRSGNIVNAISINDALQLAEKRQDRRVLWRDETLPVLAAFTQAGQQVLFGKPANNKQLSRIIEPLCGPANIKAQLRSHDLRRRGITEHLDTGTASQIKEIRALNGMAFGHSRRSIQAGATDKYYKPMEQSSWKRRMALKSPSDFDVGLAATAQKKRKISSKEIDDECRELGLDPNLKGARVKARDVIQKSDFKIWKDSQEGPLPARSANVNVLRQLHVNSLYADRNLTGSITTQDGQDLEEPELNEEEKDKEGDEGEEEQELVVMEGGDHEEMVIDPRLLALIVPGADHDDASSADLVADIADSELLVLESNSTEHSLFLNITPLEFVTKFSQINLTCKKSFKHEPVDYVRNSRDKLEPFIFRCKNAELGCLTTRKCAADIRTHETTCRITSLEASRKYLGNKPYRCPEPACVNHGGFSTKQSLAQHKSSHAWVAKRCNWPDCTDETQWATRSRYSSHRRRHVEAIPETRCTLTPCPKQAPFTNLKAYRLHLNAVHSLSSELCKPYLDAAKATNMAITSNLDDGDEED
jgi:hypothetical protein